MVCPHAIEHHLDTLIQAIQTLQGHQQSDGIPQRGEFQLGDEQNDIGMTQGGQVSLAIAFTQIDNDVGEGCPQQAEHAVDLFFLDSGGVFELHGMG
ncbi:hypothetical protein HRbin36_02226 [bacterium HR36]|nr:hypothetical protein HRbin36_02226 [bacterium HR36]